MICPAEFPGSLRSDRGYEMARSQRQPDKSRSFVDSASESYSYGRSGESSELKTHDDGRSRVRAANLKKEREEQERPQMSRELTKVGYCSDTIPDSTLPDLHKERTIRAHIVKTSENP